MAIVDAQTELERFLVRKSHAFADAVTGLARARVGLGSYDKAVSELAGLLRHTLTLSNLYGRRRMLLESDAVRRSARFATVIPDVIPDVTFDEAVNDLVSREPRLAASVEELSRLYSTEHVFGAVRSIDLTMTKRIQDALATFMREGVSQPEATQVMREITDWTRSYSELVYRNNLSTAYTQGRFEQAKDPDVSEIVPAMMYESLDDSDVRPNHRAASGMIAATDDPIWRTFQPPIGHNCRCSANFVSRWELERRGLIQENQVIRYLPPGFDKAHPDEGFKVGAPGWVM